MSKARRSGTTPNVMYLGAGAVYFNWGLEDEVYVGATKGGSDFSDNAEFRQTEYDGNYFPGMGEEYMTKMMPQLTIKSLTLAKENLLKFYGGMKEDNSEVGKTRLYRTFDMCGSYIKNIAFVGVTASSCGAERYILVVLKNVLGINPFTIPATGKEEEIVVDAVLTAHIDQTEFNFSDMTTYPYYIEFSTSELTFNVDDGTDPIDGADIIFNISNYVKTDEMGVGIMYVEGGNRLPYTINKDGYEEHKGVVDLDTDLLDINVTLTAVTP